MNRTFFLTQCPTAQSSPRCESFSFSFSFEFELELELELEFSLGILVIEM